MGKLIQAAIALMLTATPVMAMSDGGDAEKGAKVFKKCKNCHVADEKKKKIGPHLVGLFGRTAGTVEGYKYKKAMIDKGKEGLVWNAETLDEFLTKPKKFVPGTKMSFPGLSKASDRKNLIAYLMKVTKPAE